MGWQRLPERPQGRKDPSGSAHISVVDFYDATRCDRPYRKGMKREDSLALLNKMTGSSFDPKLVDLFSKHVMEFDKLIGNQDIQEQVASQDLDLITKTKPDAGL